MKNKIIFIIIGLTLLIIAGSIFFYVTTKNNKIILPENNNLLNKNEDNNSDNKNNKNLNPNEKISPELSNKEKIKYNNGIYTKALEEKNDILCGQITEKRQEDLCLKEVAIELAEKNICEKITDKEIKNSCNNTLLFNTAIKEKNLSLCQKINEEYKEQLCLAEIIKTNKLQESECKKLEDNSSLYCQDFFMFEQAIESNNPEDCMKLMSVNQEDECYNIVFKNFKDLNLCEKYSEPIKQKCINFVAFKIASTEKNIEKCNLINDEEIRNSCKGNIELSLDDDNDGLSNSQEIIYKTNPEISDTDGDGYSDGEEVLGGYDPLK